MLEPVSSIHLKSNAGRQMKPGGSESMIRIVVLTGILILLMSCVNFINIALAKMTTRMKEVGIRRVLGAVRAQLVFQFITEIAISFIMAPLGCRIAGVLAFHLRLRPFTGISITLENVIDARFMLVLASVFVVVIFLSGYFPATAVSTSGVLNAFRNKTISSSGKLFNTRNSLVLLQVMISGMLILFGADHSRPA